MKRRAVAITVASVVVVLVIAALTAFFISRRPRRRTAVRIAPPTAHEKETATLGSLPQPSWTPHIAHLENGGEWKRLDDELAHLATANRAAYDRFSFGYLHARVKFEVDEPGDGLKLLAPFLAGSSPFRDLALYRAAEGESDLDHLPAASRYRQELIAKYPQSPYFTEAFEDELSYLDEHASPDDLLQFYAARYPSASTEWRRELDARAAGALMRKQQRAQAIAKAVLLLRGSISDDPAERAATLLDRSDIIGSLPPDELLLLGDSMHSHRHFDRAIAILTVARSKVPPAKVDDVTFSIGRAQFGNEKYADAQKTYTAGAAAAKTPKAKATFLFHASRCAQLLGNDVAGEQLLTAALAVPGKFPATSAALTQRLRTRVKQKRMAEAESDLAQIRKLFPKDHAVVDASIALAVGSFAYGNPARVIATLNAIPPPLATKWDRTEIDYWIARATEHSNPQAAVARYLSVLRAPVPTHFAYFARHRLRDSAISGAAAAMLSDARAKGEAAFAAKNFQEARERFTDVVLLSPQSSKPDLDRLAATYREIPAYRAILDIEPKQYPQLPAASDRDSLLMALGLFDDAIGSFAARYPLRPLSSGVTQSLAFNLGAASKSSILAIEIVMKSVPNDFVPELMPKVVLELLYPRYFYEAIAEDAKKYDADPRLVLSIMREESRFNPRAKSQAAARGLLQFIITTARQVGRDLGLVKVDTEDLYDPRLVIQLGAKYIGTLLEKFGRNPYDAAGAYNAGPTQVALWLRLAPAAGDDFFLSSINFDETKDYVRKVINSYERYGEIYEQQPPVGGTHPEP